MNVTKVHRNVIEIELSGIRAGWEKWILLRSDAHHDHPKCDREMEKRHLDEALERDALIVDNGDLFCAMQGASDRRGSKSSIRKEHLGANYFDLLVDEAYEFYRPYAQNFLLFGRGNHETAILKHNETDLTGRLVRRLQREKGSIAQESGYTGMVLFRCTLRGTVRRTISLMHYHGFGGGGGTNKGVGQATRMSSMFPDPNIILSGHTHDEFIVPIPRQRISQSGTPYTDEQLHVRVPGYKKAWDDGFGGFEVEKGMGPKPAGAAWLRLFVNKNNMAYEAFRAT